MKIAKDNTFESATFNNTSEFSDVQALDSMLGYSVALVYTGSSIAATANLQASIDGVDWFDLPDSGETAHHTLSASGGSNFWNVSNVFYPKVRLKIVSSDTNDVTATAKIYAKGV